MIDLASNLNIIQKSGAWYAYEGEKIGQGRENAKQYLAEHPEVFEEVAGKVREHFGLGTDAKGEASDENDMAGGMMADAGEGSKEDQ